MEIKSLIKSAVKAVESTLKSDTPAAKVATLGMGLMYGSHRGMQAASMIAFGANMARKEIDPSYKLQSPLKNSISRKPAKFAIAVGAVGVGLFVGAVIYHTQAAKKAEAAKAADAPVADLKTAA